MSLYNKLLGFNKWSLGVLNELGIHPGETGTKIPRFRDAFVDEQLRLVIYTRTGGANRKTFESKEVYLANGGEEDEDMPVVFNEDLRHLPGYLFDEDDPNDSTFALFRYRPIDERVRRGLEMGKEFVVSKEPCEKFKALMKKIASTDFDTLKDPDKIDDPELANAVSVMQAFTGALKKAEKSDGAGPTILEL